MSQKSLHLWTRTSIIGLALLGMTVYMYILPTWGLSTVNAYPEFSHFYLPWLVFLLITAIPCYAVLVFAWQISIQIKNNTSFSQKTSHLLKHISMTAFIDSVFFLTGNILFLFLNMNHPGVILLSLIIVSIGIVIALTAAILSHFVLKAADLQEQSNATV